MEPGKYIEKRPKIHEEKRYGDLKKRVIERKGKGVRRGREG